jgi:CopG antitoxin of type II toxin-antitoxin system
MAGGRRRDPIPVEFGSVAEAAEFWDRHDLGDYGDQLSEVSAEVDLSRRTFLTALEPELAKDVSALAEKLGVSTETLINLWLREKLSAATASK